MGGNFHPMQNIVEFPIVNKYREGKLKRTLGRELNVLEIARIEVNLLHVFLFKKSICC